MFKAKCIIITLFDQIVWLVNFSRNLNHKNVHHKTFFIGVQKYRNFRHPQILQDSYLLKRTPCFVQHIQKPDCEIFYKARKSGANLLGWWVAF